MPRNSFRILAGSMWATFLEAFFTVASSPNAITQRVTADDDRADASCSRKSENNRLCADEWEDYWWAW